MSGIRRVVFTGDILRPFPAANGWESATHKNVRWLAHLIGWQIERATGLPVERVSWDPRGNGGFDAARFYETVDLPMHTDSWAALFHTHDLPVAAERMLTAPFEDALVIGVEIPDVMQMALAARGIPFVDVVSHPVRFMDDLLFALRTSHDGVHGALLRRAFDLDRCVPYANLHRAKAAWMPALDVPHGTALITGQVATDKAVISRAHRRFVSLADHVERLFEICERHPLVLYKPHPYQGADCPSRAVIQSFGAIRFVDHNFYYLMGQDAITDVYAISSGTVHEAPYFGKHGHGFIDPLYEFGERTPQRQRAGACVPIGDAMLSPAFWSEVLEPCVATRAGLPEGPAPRESRLRRTLNADWDHGWIDAVVQRVHPATPAPARSAQPIAVRAA